MWVAFEIHWAIVIPNVRKPLHSLIKVTTQTSSVINIRHIAIGCFLRPPKAIYIYEYANELLTTYLEICGIYRVRNQVN